MDEFEATILSQFRQIVDEVKEKKITRQEAVARLHELAGTIEEDQWRIVDDLRTRAPEDESELARAVADLLEAELRKGSGNA
jgi:Asp-tRNA(Asn)/Glu-tRNA(Gln) amidotransferase B subunit